MNYLVSIHDEATGYYTIESFTSRGEAHAVACAAESAGFEVTVQPDVPSQLLATSLNLTTDITTDVPF